MFAVLLVLVLVQLYFDHFHRPPLHSTQSRAAARRVSKVNVEILVREPSQEIVICEYLFLGFPPPCRGMGVYRALTSLVLFQTTEHFGGMLLHCLVLSPTTGTKKKERSPEEIRPGGVF